MSNLKKVPLEASGVAPAAGFRLRGSKRLWRGLFLVLWVVCAPVGPAFAAVQNFSELCRTGTAEEVRQALSEGADPNASDEKEKLPLFEALLNPDLKVLQTLIEAGADVERRNSPLYPGDIGDTPLHNAVLNLCHNRERPGRIRMSPEVLRILLDAGADVNADSSLGTPLYRILILDDCNPETVDFLISEGADVNFRDSDDETPLMRAAETGTCPEIVRLLLDAGADANAQRKDGWTPLMLAVLSGIDVFRSHPDAEHNISLLLEAGADPNIMAKGDEVGPSFTALSVAAWGNDRKAAKLLLEAGADPDLKDSHGYTAFARASRMLSGDVADLLLFGGSAPLRVVFWGFYVFTVALPFVVLKGNASRLFAKGKNIRKFQAWSALMEIVLILFIESAPFWSSFLFKNNSGFSPDVRRSIPLVARLAILLPNAVGQLYFLLVEQKKIAFSGEAPQKRPFLHVIGLILLMALVYVLLRSAGSPPRQ